jgi:hypothetical protein
MADISSCRNQAQGFYRSRAQRFDRSVPRTGLSHVSCEAYANIHAVAARQAGLHQHIGRTGMNSEDPWPSNKYRLMISHLEITKLHSGHYPSFAF